MAKKVHVTKTFAPLQFEALEPHRFEDLVRDLLYDYRDWQRIEATGRGGSDAGFDIRAYEKTVRNVLPERDDEDEVDDPVVIEGNLWMIQCKREKQLSAGKITTIIADAVKKESPPYGYILAAPTNFTKKSYDAFRAALIERGVLEFQMLGRAELEDMLYQPKNDRVLFAFFGVSLVSRRRSRVTEIRSIVNNKNKLYRIFGGTERRNFYERVLIRDTNDTLYPYTDKYPDFEKNPRWKEYTAYAHHTQGIRFHVRKFFAYLDHSKKEWDFVPAVDLVHQEVDDREEVRRKQDLHTRVSDFWEHLPLGKQGYRVVDGLILYGSFDLIDKEGDEKYKMPHLFSSFSSGSPFDGYWDFLTKHNEQEHFSLDDFKKVDFFPKSFPEPAYGRVYDDKELEAPSYLVHRLQEGQHCYFDLENEYGFLRQRDIIGLPKLDGRSDGKLYAEVMYGNGLRFRICLSQILRTNGKYSSKWIARLMHGRRSMFYS